MGTNIYVSPFQPHLQVRQENKEDNSNGDTCSTNVVGTSVVQPTQGTTSQIPSQRREPCASRTETKRLNASSSTTPRGSLLKKSLDSWREKTKLQYAVYHRRWSTYCILKGIDLLNSTLNNVLLFLLSLFDSGLRYSALNSARSALSCVLPFIDGVSVGTHPLVLRVMRSFYNKRPPQARYSQMWDPEQVLAFLREKTPLKDLSIKDLTLKMCMLFMLATCSRQQRLALIKRSNIKFQKDGSLDIIMDELQKHSSRGKSLEVISIKPFQADRSNCVVRNIKVYLQKTNELTNAGDNLICSFAPPYGKVGTQTIARWIKLTMKDAGVDIGLFKAQSTRGASASKLAKLVLLSQK